MLAKYIGNPSASDRTSIIKLAVVDGRRRSLHLGGPAVDITEQEFYSIMANGYQLERLDEEAIESDDVQPTETVDVDPEPEAETDEEEEDQSSEFEDTDMTQSYGASPTSPYGADHEGL